MQKNIFSYLLGAMAIELCNIIFIFSNVLSKNLGYKKYVTFYHFN